MKKAKVQRAIVQRTSMQGVLQSLKGTSSCGIKKNFEPM
jgi:hypothetical protein